MSAVTTGIGVLIAVVLLILIATLFMVSRLFRKVEQGHALIISKVNTVDVTFTGSMVLPVLHKAEMMDISVKTIEIRRTGREGLICRDNIRADVHIAFFVRVNKTTEDVIKVAQAIGTERASHQETLQLLFAAKFSEALKTVGKQLDFVDLYTKREEFRDHIIRVIGTDLNGYHLEDAAIDFLEQTPMSQLDAQNILDAQGIRKITELTAIEHVRTNEFQNTERKEITRQNVDAREAILEMERRQADAENKQRREVETVKAKEEAEIALVQAQERLRSETAYIRTDEQLGIQRANQAREIAVADKNRERVIAVENERIEKDRMLEVIIRERETELASIAKNKEVEGEKRDIAEVIRERISVEKTVAEQEEAIKRVRIVEDASRNREARIINAEAEAQEHLVKDIKAAEAAETASKFKAREQLVLAEARQQAAELDAQAAIRTAEGLRAEAAAAGLAEVEVREADAEAIEKVGRAEAVVLKEKGLAQAEATDKVGRAEAGVLREMALSEAESIKAKLKGEAEGLTEKAAAMAALDDASRGHEEFRLRLQADKDIRIAEIDVQRQVAEAQATVLATGLESADISIVGGDTVFFDRLVGAMSWGKAVEGFVGQSPTVREFAPELLKSLGSVDTGDVKNLTVSALLLKLIRAGGPDSGKLHELLDTARKMGVAETPVLNGTH